MIKRLFWGVATFAALSAMSSQAQAGGARSYVALSGADSGACIQTAPCRTFAYAISQTIAGGDVVALTSGGYGPVTITKSINITSPAGVQAAISPAGGTAITIDAGDGVVSLRGLTLDGASGGIYGIQLKSALGLSISGLTARNFKSTAVSLAPTATLEFDIADSSMSDNGTNGISVIPPPSNSSSVDGSVTHVICTRNFNNGIFVNNMSSNGTLSVAIKDSIFSFNNHGITIGNTVENVHVTGLVDNDEIYANAEGLNRYPYATMLLSRSTVTRNSIGMSNSATGTNDFFTYQNNVINRNTTDINGPNPSTAYVLR